MERLLPAILPVFFGLVAGLSHGVATNSLDLPDTLGETLTQPLLGQSLSD